MATDGSATHTLDIQGLVAWSRASGNEFASIKADVESGKIQIFNTVWNEFCEVYPDEAVTLNGVIIERAKVQPQHRLASTAIAERAKATFGWKGPYDHAIEWRVAGIASCEKLVIVTDARRKKMYTGLDGITAVTYEEFVSDE
jgi:hypothetical protein